MTGTSENPYETARQRRFAEVLRELHALPSVHTDVDHLLAKALRQWQEGMAPGASVLSSAEDADARAAVIALSALSALAPLTDRRLGEWMVAWDETSPDELTERIAASVRSPRRLRKALYRNPGPHRVTLHDASLAFDTLRQFGRSASVDTLAFEWFSGRVELHPDGRVDFRADGSWEPAHVTTLTSESTRAAAALVGGMRVLELLPTGLRTPRRTEAHKRLRGVLADVLLGREAAEEAIDAVVGELTGMTAPDEAPGPVEPAPSSFYARVVAAADRFAGYGATPLRDPVEGGVVVMPGERLGVVAAQLDGRSAVHVEGGVTQILIGLPDRRAVWAPLGQLGVPPRLRLI